MVYGAIPGADGTDAAAAPPQRCRVAFAIIVCLLTISVVPLANKAVLQRGAHGAPLAMTACQLAGAALLFGLWYVLHAAATGRLERPTRAELRRKARNIGPLGVAFGLKLGVTNVGLALVSVELHVLLAATDIFWTALFARLINREVPSFTGAFALVGCFAGACLVTTNATDAVEPGGAPLYAIALNLIGPAFQGVVVALLRRSATREIEDEKTSYAEFTFVKLCFSALTAFPVALAVEGVATVAAFLGSLACDLRFVASTLLISGVQLSFTVLATLTSSTSVGVVGTCKVVPQWLLAFVANGTSLSPQHLATQHLQHLLGVLLVTLSAVVWAAAGGARPRGPSAARVLAEVFDASPPGSPGVTSPALVKLGSF
jgi:hypothetical protein